MLASPQVAGQPSGCVGSDMKYSHLHTWSTASVEGSLRKLFLYSSVFVTQLLPCIVLHEYKNMHCISLLLYAHASEQILYLFVGKHCLQSVMDYMCSCVWIADRKWGTYPYLEHTLCRMLTVCQCELHLERCLNIIGWELVKRHVQHPQSTWLYNIT